MNDDYEGYIIEQVTTGGPMSTAATIAVTVAVIFMFLLAAWVVFFKRGKP